MWGSVICWNLILEYGFWILECVELSQTVLYKESLVTLNNTTLVKSEFFKVGLDLTHFHQCTCLLNFNSKKDEADKLDPAILTWSVQAGNQ